MRIQRNADLLSSDQRREDDGTLQTSEGRQLLLPLLAADVSRGDLDPFWAMHTGPALLRPQDVPWLIARIEQTAGTAEERGWAALLAAALQPEETDINAVLEAAERSPTLRAELAAWLDPVGLDTENARHHRERAERRRARDAPPADAPEMSEEIARHLERAEAGDSQGWWGLNWCLLFDEHGRATDATELEADLRELPGWQRADPEQRDRMLAAAKRYVLDAEPQPDEWFGTNKIWKPAFAGYRALRLAATLDPKWLDTISPDVWARWAPIIVGYPLSNAQPNGADEDVLRHAAAAAPAGMAEWFVRRVDADNLSAGSLFSLWRLRNIRAPAVVDALIRKAGDRTLQPKARQDLLEFALVHDAPRGVALAARLLSPEEASGDESGRALAVLAAATALRLALAEAWPLVRPLIEADHEFGRRVFEQVEADEHRGLQGDLDDESLAGFVTTLFGLFPPADDPTLEAGAHWVSSREQLGRLRDRLLGVLAERGTDSAVGTIERLRGEHPHAHVLRFRLRDARDARRARWPAPDPGDVVELAHTTDARIVTCASHLQQLVVASLRRAERALQGTPPRAWELWNQKPLTPKDEGALSDWLQGWLDQDLRLGGRLIGRELQVRPSASGRGRGESVDLQVSAAAGEHVQDAETVTVRVEVKGCWNPDLDTGMDDQLAQRYLQPSALTHGIYVVGLFDAADWAAGDRRGSVCRRLNLADARERFSRQADEVSARRDVEVEAVVLDVRLPKPRERPHPHTPAGSVTAGAASVDQ